MAKRPALATGRKGRPPSGLPDHTSHSARETLERCAKAYFLSRIAKAPSRPALWLAGGSAVHEATEKWDRDFCDLGQEPEWSPKDVFLAWQHFFDKQLRELREREPNENSWRRSQSEPIETWNVNGPAFVRAYIDWRQRSPWEIWTTPDGEPAIELDVSGFLPGCPVEIKAYVDRIFHDPVFGQHPIVDLKTGKRPPKTPAQFETYKALVKVKYGIDCEIGVPFMNRKATLGKPFDLSEVTPEVVGEVYGRAWEQIERGDFPANGFDSECFLCDVSAACYAKNGPLAVLYDPAHPEHLSNRPPY